MIFRNDNKVKVNPRQDDLEFQVIDWRAYDYKPMRDSGEEENDDYQGYYEDDEESTVNRQPQKKYIIQAYGFDKNKNSICLTIEDFTPYFFIEVPRSWSAAKFRRIIAKVKSKVPKWNQDGLISYKIVERMKFFGFRNEEKFTFARLVFQTKSASYDYLKQLKEKIIIPEIKESITFKKDIYESNIDPMLRFMHLRSIDPASWIKIPMGAYHTSTPKRSKCNIDVVCHWKKVFKSEVTNIGAIRVLAFDIECTSEDGSFPKAERSGDKIIQIGSTCHEYGSRECHFKHIVTLKDSSPVEGVMVESFHTEKDLLVAWAKIVEKYDPDVITGYNIFGFDWEYIFKRAKLGMGNNSRDYSEYLLKHLSRNREKPAVYVEKQLSSSALGDNFLRYVDCPGRVPIDMFKLAQKDFKLDSYKLDNVANTFLKINKIDLKPHQIFKKYMGGTPEEIGEIAEYCIRDCELCNKLIIKLETLANNIGMANVCTIPLSYLFLRGQGVKIFSLVAKQCQKEGYLITVLEKSDDSTGYEGAIVFTPTPGIYMDPITILDYGSLYPASMISENLSHDTEVTDPKYLNLPDYDYNHITYDVFEGLGDDKVKVGESTSIFAEKKSGEKGVLPRILMHLLKARKDTRQKINFKTLTLNNTSLAPISKPIGLVEEKIDEERGEAIYVIKDENNKEITVLKKDVEKIEDTYTEFEKAVLDGLQLAYKITANSLYGQVGAVTSQIHRKPIAASTTATGRSLVVLARDKITEHFPGTKSVYGDSVTADTPLLLRDVEGHIQIITIEELFKINECESYEEFKPFDTNRKEKQQSKTDYQVWTSNGWSEIKRVIRHKTNKKIYRVNTDIGCVDVTEDHSLLDETGNKIKPNECQVGQKLLHGCPLITIDGITDRNKFERPTISDLVNDSVINHKNNKKDLYKNPFIIDDKVTAQSIYFYLKFCSRLLYLVIQRYKLMPYISVLENNKYEIGLKKYYSEDTDPDTKSDTKSDTTNQHHLDGQIISIEYIRDTAEGEFVYDLETETGNFQAGIGEIIVKNTDSVFLNFVPYIKDKYGNDLNDEEILTKCLELGLAAEKYMGTLLKYPHKCEYEKIFWPFIIFSKKRYVGNKYEFDIHKFKQTSMGIVLKRRDNAMIVKDIYGGIINKILNERDQEGAKQYFKDQVSKLLDGDVDTKLLVITKSLSGNYANPTQIAHKVLADKIAERDPGNKPQSNDRIPFCYIDEKDLSCDLCNKKKLNPSDCKCRNCMKLFCPLHLNAHKNMCEIICRFCRIKKTDAEVIQCNTCRGWYCQKDMIKHKTKNDKYGNQHFDKCKKELPTKLLQGDIIEHPEYIAEKNIKINYRYYLDHQIMTPCLQIFELMMKDPESLVRAAIRKDNNIKNNNQDITKWFTVI